MMTFTVVLAQLLNTGVKVLRPSYSTYNTPSTVAGWVSVPKFSGGGNSSYPLSSLSPFNAGKAALTGSLVKAQPLKTKSNFPRNQSYTTMQNGPYVPTIPVSVSYSFWS